MQWYYVLSGERAGPVSQEQFNQLLQAGVIRGDTLVWNATMSAWQPWAQVAAAMAAQNDSAVCVVSGRVFPKREMLEYQGKWVSAEYKDVFFQRIREGMPFNTPNQTQYAGFWIRFVAIFIDGVCLWVVNMLFGVIYFIALMVFGGLDSAGGRHMDSASSVILIGVQLFIYVLQIAAAIAFDVFFIRKFDATPGKLALGIKVVRANGEKLTTGRIIGRYFAKGVSFLILGIGYMMAGWDDQKRSLHDIMCDTRVVRK